MLGTWKNYEELEESLSFAELVATINAMRDKDKRDKKFFAMLQGVDLDEIEAEILDSKQDILTLKGQNAVEAGFGIGMGLGFAEIID